MDDDDDYEEPFVQTAEEKALFDKRVGKIIGAIFSWEADLQNPHKINREMPTTSLNHSSIECETFDKEIPLTSYLESYSSTSWLEVERLKVYCLARCVNQRLIGGSTAFQLSNSYVGTTRHYSETKPGQVFVARGDFTSLSITYVPSLIAKSPLLEDKKIDISFYDSFIKKEIIPGTRNDRPDTRFDFSIMASDPEDSIKLPQPKPYIVPTCQNVNSGDPIMVVGYPRTATDQYLQASYVTSLGKIQDVSPYFMTISAATCCGMSGSPVFSFSGQLLGFLLGSKSTLKYNIRVDHPTFVIEYLTHAGRELLHDNFELYFPNIEKFVRKHFELLKNASQNSLEKRKRLKEVLSKIQNNKLE